MDNDGDRNSVERKASRDDLVGQLIVVDTGQNQSVRVRHDHRYY